MLPHNRRPRVTSRSRTSTSAETGQPETIWGKLTCRIVVLIRASSCLQVVVVAELSGKTLTVLVTAQGRWWCQRCEPCCHMAVGFWFGQLMTHWDTVTRPEARCWAIDPQTSPHVVVWWCSDLSTTPRSWKHLSSYMTSKLTGHVTHWAGLWCSGSAFVAVPAKWVAPREEEWTNRAQSAACWALCQQMCCTVWGQRWSHDVHYLAPRTKMVAKALFHSLVRNWSSEVQRRDDVMEIHHNVTFTRGINIGLVFVW